MTDSGDYPGDDQVQRVTGAMRRLRHVLDATERLQQFRQADRLDVVSIVDVNIKIAEDNNKTSKRCKSLKNCRQFVEKLF